MRSVAIIVSILAAAAAPQSWGLGLGEIELDSALNQQFSATIELFDASGLEPSEIIVTLGSAEDFERVGVERFFFLTSLSFKVAYAANGDPQIVVTSSRPITEPYLNFLVQVLWPNGRLLKEYTVLLDPPTFSEAAAPAVSSPSQDRTASNTGRVQRLEPATSGTRVQTNPASAPPAGGPSPLDRGIEGDEYGMTDRDDTLWSIASRARPSSSVSVHQTMLAIVRMNPDAFINGNVNLLKAGFVLRLPDEAQARTLSQQDALLEVARHEEAWRAYNRGEAIADRGAAPQPRATTDQTSSLRSTVDASASTTPATSARASDGELRIVAEDGDSTTGVAGQVASAELESALEETDRLGREVEQLTYQLDREKELASNEIAVKERQIEVKDQQIAELQAQLAAAREALASETAGEPPTQSQNQSARADATPWWQSPPVMYGGAGVLVLLLVGGMIVQRRRRAAEAENDYFDAEEAFAEEERLAPSFAELEDAEEDEDRPFEEAEEAHRAEEEVTGSQTSDVIGEADIYIAYGRYPQAIGLLLGVLEDEPERNDVRLKLLEVYAESGERAAFDEHMASLIEYCDDEEALLTARELENKFGEETVSLDDMMAEERATATVETPAEEARDTLESIEFESTRADAGESAEAEDTSLDFELELDELETAADGGHEEREEDGAGDQLGGDLGIDFNPDEAEADAQAEEDRGIEFSSSSDEISLDDFDTEDDSGRDTLQQAAAGRRGQSAQADLEEEADGDLALETLSEDESDPLDELEFETATSGRTEDDFEFEDEGDSANTKLDLARAYIDMGDADGARDILKEVLDEGNSDQQQKARAMLESL
ncbi:MAG: FimV/HubP family polar landmark protein [Pseudomonadales bacterium]